MADDEVKIKITAEDNYSGPMQRKIKMLEKLAKQYAPAIKMAEKLDKLTKVDRRVNMYLKTDKVRAEYDRLERRHQKFKQQISGKALALKVGVQESISRKLDLLKSRTAFLKKPYNIAIALKDKASMKLAGIEGKARWAMSKLKILKNIPAGIRDRASPVIEKIRSKTRWMGKGVKLAITAKDKVSGAIGGIKSKLGGLISMAAKGIAIAVTVVGAGALSALKDGMQLENQTISMEHFIGVNNDGKSKSQIKGMTDDYIKYLRNNAKKTPFTTEEVMGAGSRAIGVAGGDISKAQKMLELSEDMAALTPGKTVMDAMEALADADLGEMERLKEFGFKGSKEQFDAAGGDIMKMQNDKGFGLEQLFAGGAEKLSTSGAGLWSTIMGGLGDIKTDIGTQLLEKIKPGLKTAVDWLDKNGVALTESISGIVASGLNKITEIGGKVGKAFEPLVKTAQSAFKRLGPTFKSISDTAGKLFDALLENGVPILQDFINFATPVFEKLWKVILKPFIDWVVSQMPVFREAFKAVLDFLEPKLGTIIDIFGILGSAAKIAWEVIKFAIQLAWSIIEPIFTWWYEAIQGAIDKVNEMKEEYGPTLEAIGGFFEAFSEVALKAIDWIIGRLDKLIGKSQEARDAMAGLGGETSATGGDGSNGSGGGTRGSSTNDTGGMRPYATGIRNVPRDNYPALLHKGEAVVPARDNRGKGKGGSITVAKLADTIVVREEADIDKIASRLVKKIEETALNMA